MFQINEGFFANVFALTMSTYFLSVFKWFLIGLAIMLLLMLLTGLLWYFRKLWTLKEDESGRTKLHNSIKWMVFSWLGLLSVEVILVIVYFSVGG